MRLDPVMYRRLLAEGRVSDLNRIMANEVDVDSTGKIIPIVAIDLPPVVEVKPKPLYTLQELKELNSSQQFSLLKSLGVKSIPKLESGRITLLFNMGAVKEV